MTSRNSTGARPLIGRLAVLVAAVTVLAGLSGCVIAPYPDYGYYHRDHYWHDHDDYYRGYDR
ncbi:MAG TPA: hypothetical protein VMC10_15545 [Stellaceae bacterium]|nr:hypothetical protein [Stellaceae bacterium]